LRRHFYRQPRRSGNQCATRRGCVLGLLAVGLVGLLLSGCQRPAPARQAKEKTAPLKHEEIKLESALGALKDQGDASACRSALKQLNACLSRAADRQPQLLTAAREKFLRERVGLDPAEIQEVGAVKFTLLDGAYLEGCILLRDAAQALDVEHLSPLERAQVAFDWMCREIWREDQSAASGQEREKLIPTMYVLRRAHGSDLDRSVAFLDMMHQLGQEGCLVCVPSADRGFMRPWLVGVLIKGDIYLFDVRLGVPVPGSQGQPGTLKDLVAHPEALSAFDAGAERRYDVTAKDVKEAQLWLAPPLSALAGRMNLLEGLWGASNGVRLSSDPEALLSHFQEANRGGVLVRFIPRRLDGESPIVALRRFLPPDQGGTDFSQRLARFESAMVNWPSFPAIVDRVSPPDREPGRHLRALFQWRFTSIMLPPGSPRDQMLRGYFDEAAEALINARDEVSKFRAMLQSDDTIGQDFVKWHQEAVKAYADYYHAENSRPPDANLMREALREKDQAWRRGDQVVSALLVGSAAERLGRMQNRLLAMCTHEAAERRQRHMGRHRDGVGADSQGSTREAWKVAADWWQTCIAASPATMDPGRIWRAQALEALGETDQATALLEDLSNTREPTDQLGRLYRARLLKSQKSAMGDGRLR
jgi:hypothetical protein